MNTVGSPVIDGVLILIAWALICAAARFLGQWLVHLRTALLSKGADAERIRRELDSILCDCSNFEKLCFAAGHFINIKQLQDEADERESERNTARQTMIPIDPDQLANNRLDLRVYSED